MSLINNATLKTMLKILIFIILCTCIMNCSSTRQFNLAPIKTFDPDNVTIPPPKESEEFQIWDATQMTSIYQVEKALNLNLVLREIGKPFQISKNRQADNVNILDEVPNSSWFTNRHFQERMSLKALARGPNITDGPDKNGKWIITRGKFEGGTPGFTIKDSKGDYYLVKLDAPKCQEMGSSAEVITTKILYACGYNVPQNTAESINPDAFEIGETANVLEWGKKRKMTEQDLKKMLKDTPRDKNGKIRVLASKYVSGKPVGVWHFRGRRSDDPNDRVDHEHRRELRGLRVIGSWLNDADRRSANTLAVYTEENGQKFIKHYIIDMGSTLGSNNKFPHGPKYGYEYLFDPRTIGKSLVSLGLYVKPWEFEQRHLNPEFPSVGYFESEMFDPGKWVPTFPNPAFEKCTLRDAYWGAKIVMSFTDEEIRAIVETANLSDPAAKEFLIRTMIERRDKVGRYWFARMNPLDKFRIENHNGAVSLVFNDLAVDGKLNTADESKYLYELFHNDKQLHQEKTIDQASIIISEKGQGILDSFLKENKTSREEDKIFHVTIHTQRAKQLLSKAVTVYFYYPGVPGKPRIVGIEREE